VSQEFAGGRRVTPFRGSMILFGFPSTGVEGEVIPRSRNWRGLRLFGFLAGGLVLAPLVGLIPPHAPWAVGALGVGLFFGIRKWRERLTLVSFQGGCPKCGAEIRLKPGSAVRNGMSITCDQCHHDSVLSLDLEKGS
jgi:hypothetical protein